MTQYPGKVLERVRRILNEEGNYEDFEKVRTAQKRLLGRF
jgi:hypothetical protein